MRDRTDRLVWMAIFVLGCVAAFNTWINSVQTEILNENNKATNDLRELLEGGKLGRPD